MKQRNQTVFYLERLQPDWLSSSYLLQIYNRWAVRLPSILIGMLVSLTIASLLFSFLFPFFVIPSLNIMLGGFLGWLLSAESTTQERYERSGLIGKGRWSRLTEWLWVSVFIGLIAGWYYGTSVGLLFGLDSLLLQAVQLSHKPEWKHSLGRVGIRNGILVGLLFGLSAGLSSWLGQGNGLLFGLSFGLSLGLCGGILSVLLIGKPRDVSLIDKLIWSWKSLFAKRHLCLTLSVMVLIELGVVLIYGLRAIVSAGLIGMLSFGLSKGLSEGLIGMLSGGLSFWLLFGLFQGVSSEVIGDQRRIIPNQGIRHSARNGLVLGLTSAGIVWLSTWLIVWLSGGLSEGLSQALSNWHFYGFHSALRYGLRVALVVWQYPTDDLNYGLGIGLCAGLLAGLFNGGLACLRHSVLRLLLWRAGSMPWHYPRFLDEAAKHLLLTKVGGGYLFVHRLLLEYFASLDD